VCLLLLNNYDPVYWRGYSQIEFHHISKFLSKFMNHYNAWIIPLTFFLFHVSAEWGLFIGMWSTRVLIDQSACLARSRMRIPSSMLYPICLYHINDNDAYPQTKCFIQAVSLPMFCLLVVKRTTMTKSLGINQSNDASSNTARACVCMSRKPGNTNWGERISTIDLLIKVACLVKKANNIFKLIRSWSSW